MLLLKASKQAAFGLLQKTKKEKKQEPWAKEQ